MKHFEASISSRIKVGFRAMLVGIWLAAIPVSVAQVCQSGIPPSNPTNAYIVDIANGTVTDPRTGLMWDRCLQGLSGADCNVGATQFLDWDGALAAASAANSATYKGYSDWRLPNIKELVSSYEYCNITAALGNGRVFPLGPGASNLWSSSPAASAAGFAYLLSGINGKVAREDRPLVGPNSVRLVRGGQ
jgi:hypothetical protein